MQMAGAWRQDELPQKQIGSTLCKKQSSRGVLMSYFGVPQKQTPRQDSSTRRWFERGRKGHSWDVPGEGKPLTRCAKQGPVQVGSPGGRWKQPLRVVRGRGELLRKTKDGPTSSLLSSACQEPRILLGLSSRLCSALPTQMSSETALCLSEVQKHSAWAPSHTYSREQA